MVFLVNQIQIFCKIFPIKIRTFKFIMEIMEHLDIHEYYGKVTTWFCANVLIQLA